jgi:ribosomal protein S18 acetylase RimI-like enzyme
MHSAGGVSLDSFRIRRAEEGDVSVIVRIVNSDKMYKSIIPEEYYQDPFITQEDLERYLWTMDLTFYLCKKGDTVCGVGALIVREDGDGQLGWVFILPEHQRMGAGTALVAQIENEARGRGLERIVLETDSGAYWAISFYRGLGYKEYKRREIPWGHQVWLAKSLL